MQKIQELSPLVEGKVNLVETERMILGKVKSERGKDGQLGENK